MYRFTVPAISRRRLCSRSCFSAIFILATLTHCDMALKPVHLIEASVEGLTGSGLVLEVNGHDGVPVNADGAVTLTYMVEGYYYSVAVKSQPTNPSQTCVVSNATGVIGTSDVMNVTVVCSINRFSVSGSVSGLAGSGLVLQLDDEGSLQSLPISADANGNASFTFSTPVASGATYTVTAATQPVSPGQICSVSGSGVMESSDIANITVICSMNAYTVSGAVAGLIVGTKVTLQTNGTDDLEITGSTNSSVVGFTFKLNVADGARYRVTVGKHPESPAQTCVVSNGEGTVGGANITDVTIACSSLVTVGDSVAATSPDGVTWTKRIIPAGTYRSVAWNGSVFAAVGYGVAATSPDGITWTARTINGTYYGVAWNGSLFVAVGNLISTSPDGITWTERTDLLGSDYQDIVWNGSRFVAVGWRFHYSLDTGQPMVKWSQDGLTWTTIDSTVLLSNVFNAVSWNGDLFAACGADYTTRYGICATSMDGADWSLRTIPSHSTGEYKHIAWNGQNFAAVGTYTSASSPDGISWTIRAIPPGHYNGVTWNHLTNLFVAVGYEDNNGVCATSSDGITWTGRTIPTGRYYGIIKGGAQ